MFPVSRLVGTRLSKCGLRDHWRLLTTFSSSGTVFGRNKTRVPGTRASSAFAGLSGLWFSFALPKGRHCVRKILPIIDLRKSRSFGVFVPDYRGGTGYGLRSTRVCRQNRVSDGFVVRTFAGLWSKREKSYKQRLRHDYLVFGRPHVVQQLDAVMVSITDFRLRCGGQTDGNNPRMFPPHASHSVAHGTADDSQRAD